MDCTRPLSRLSVHTKPRCQSISKNRNGSCTAFSRLLVILFGWSLVTCPAHSQVMTLKQLLESSHGPSVLSILLSRLGKTALTANDLTRQVIIQTSGGQATATQPAPAPATQPSQAPPTEPAPSPPQQQAPSSGDESPSGPIGQPEPSPLLSPEITCGQVPIYEKIFHRSFNDSMDGSPGHFRILHGLDAVFGEWPWIANIRMCMSATKCAVCTGTLLNSRWIITAGHCKMLPPDKYKVTFALYDLITPDKESFERDIDKLVLHPDYQNLENDVLLLRLAQPVQFNEFVQPACLVPQTRSVIAHTKPLHCYNVGYGLIENGAQAVKLQKISVEAKPPSSCNSDRLGSVQLKKGTVCIGPLPGHIGGSCRGDSGGPDICYNPKSNQWFIFGTVSYGPKICDRESGDNWLTVSVDLTNFRSWIINTINNDK